MKMKHIIVLGFALIVANYSMKVELKTSKFSNTIRVANKSKDPDPKATPKQDISTAAPPKKDTSAASPPKQNADAAPKAAEGFPIFDRLKKNIIETSSKYSGSPNVLSRNNQGFLNGGEYPEGMKEKALQSRNNDQMFGRVMENPPAVYMDCIHPQSQLNYNNLCTNENLGNPLLLCTCKLSFCNVCCNNLPQELSIIVEREPLAEQYGLRRSGGIEELNRFLTKGDQIKSCKKRCTVS